MPFGDILFKAREKIDLVTADEQKVVVDSKIKKLALKIFGIPHTEMRNRSRLIMHNSKLNRTDKVLDAGCGIGLYGLNYAIKQKADVIGVDMSKDKIENAEKLKKSLGITNIKFEKGDLTNLKFKDNSFDFVLCSDVLEHIPNDKKALKELARVLKKGGSLILTFPYLSEHSQEVMKKFGHARPGYNEEIMGKLAKENNLKIEKMTGYTYFFGKIAWYINEKTFRFPVLAALLFYPLYLLTYLDFTKSGKPNGLFVKLRKI